MNIASYSSKSGVSFSFSCAALGSVLALRVTLGFTGHNWVYGCAEASRSAGCVFVLFCRNGSN